MLNHIVRRFPALCRRAKVQTIVARNSGHGGFPGENIPFGITNRYRLTAWFIIYFGSGFWAPYFVVVLQYWKKGNFD